MKLILLKLPLAHGEDATNLDTMLRAVEGSGVALSADDVVLLPEHFDFRSSTPRYEHDVQSIAQKLGCHVIGGSHHGDAKDGSRSKRNSGLVAGPDGAPLGRYEKLRPYARERNEVDPGERVGEFVIGGRNVLVLICADFWFADLFARATRLPDLVLVPAFSVSRKPTPEYSRTLWRHLAVARAYEFGTYVGVSDWAHRSQIAAGLPASGVSGFADPTATDPQAFFRPVDDTGVGVYDLDFEALDRFRLDRVDRGFFWKTPA